MSPEKFDTKDLVVTTGEERTKNAHMVTVEHLPSGIGVRCYEHKSQAMNCRRALDLLWGLLVKPAPAAPVTDAEIETAVERCVDAGLQHGYLSSDLYDERERLLDLIARRVQQANAAAEDLARAVEFALEPGPLDGKEVAMTAEIRIAARALRQEKAERLRTALAAFRKAQGGA